MICMRRRMPRKTGPRPVLPIDVMLLATRSELGQSLNDAANAMGMTDTVFIRLKQALKEQGSPQLAQVGKAFFCVATADDDEEALERHAVLDDLRSRGNGPQGSGIDDPLEIVVFELAENVEDFAHGPSRRWGEHGPSAESS